jgi:hypothetical protein
MLDQFYKLGAAKAAQDFGMWLSSGLDNPTAPPVKGYTKVAIARMVDKLAAKKRKKAQPPPRGLRSKSTRFGALKRKLKKKKNR